MAGKGKGKPRKKSKNPMKPALSVERFVYDTMSNILQLCGFPAEKIPVKESEMNEYSHPNYITTVSVISLTIALGYRDTWKLMFESRFRIAGLDDIRRIEEYLSMLLNIDDEFKEGNCTSQIHMTLALYSEMVQFLNFKGQEIGLELFLISWISFFRENIAQDHSTDKLLEELSVEFLDADDFVRAVTQFVQENAIPYGKIQEISEKFENFASEQEIFERIDRRRLEAANKNIMENVGFVPPNLSEDSDFPGAGLSQATFSQNLEMGGFANPGDRESPEPPKSRSHKKCGGRSQKISRKPSAKATSVVENLGEIKSGSSSESKVEKLLEDMTLDDKSVESLKMQGARPKHKAPRKPRKLSAKAADASKRKPEASGSTASTEHSIIDPLGLVPSGYKGGDASSNIPRLGTDLPGNSDSPGLATCPELGDDEGKKPSAKATSVFENPGEIKSSSSSVSKIENLLEDMKLDDKFVEGLKMQGARPKHKAPKKLRKLSTKAADASKRRPEASGSTASTEHSIIDPLGLDRSGYKGGDATSNIPRLGTDLPSYSDTPGLAKCPELGDDESRELSAKATGFSENLGGSESSSSYSEMELPEMIDRLKSNPRFVEGLKAYAKTSRHEGGAASSNIPRLGTDLPADSDSPALAECSKPADDEGRKQSRKQSAETTASSERRALVPKRKPSSKKKRK